MSDTPNPCTRPVPANPFARKTQPTCVTPASPPPTHPGQKATPPSPFQRTTPPNPFARRAASAGGGSQSSTEPTSPSTCTPPPDTTANVFDFFQSGSDSPSSSSPNDCSRHTAVPSEKPHKQVGSRILEFLFLGSLEDAQNDSFLQSNNIRTIINLSQERYWQSDPSIRVHYFEASDSADFPIETLFRPAFRVIDYCRKAWVTKRATELAEKLGSSRNQVGAASATAEERHGGEDEDDAASDNEEEDRCLAETPPENSPGTSHPDPVVQQQHREVQRARGPGAVLVHCQKGISRSVTIVLAYLMRRNGWTVSNALDFVRRTRPIANPNIGFTNVLNKFYDVMAKDVSEPLKRAGSRGCLICKNVTVSTEAAEEYLRQFGDIWKFERRESLCMIFFCTAESKKWMMMAARGVEAHVLTGGKARLLMADPALSKKRPTAVST